ncbi:putative radical SAM family protein [Clostridiaceae bacterium JG1575]|nr:putative radical SAM family protein [Clostridiaceae bacterium JG1575]
MPSLYLHIPFCKARCGYCDFVTYTGMEESMPRYISALQEEVRRKTKGERPETIFIGGGTPTALDLKSFERLMELVDSLRKAEGNQEITLEANPESLRPELIELMRSGGINRVSMGLQSTNDDLLRFMGRIHNYRTFLEAYEALQRAGFTNLSFDLITGIPGQTQTALARTLQQTLDLEPAHCSVYSLILEQGTPFYRKWANHELTLPDDETDRLLQDLMVDGLTAAGYERYEISNYSKPGFACRHNLNYWALGEYWGCGAAAAEYVGHERALNVASLSEYLLAVENGKDPTLERKVQTHEEEIEEFIFMGLRQTQGISRAVFKERFGRPVEAIYDQVLPRFLASGVLVLTPTHLYLTRRGLDISNYILSDFLLSDAALDARSDDRAGAAKQSLT